MIPTRFFFFDDICFSVSFRSFIFLLLINDVFDYKALAIRSYFQLLAKMFSASQDIEGHQLLFQGLVSKNCKIKCLICYPRALVNVSEPAQKRVTFLQAVVLVLGNL